MVRSGFSSTAHFLPKSQDDSGVAAEERSGLYQRRGLAFRESRPQLPGLQIVGCFGGYGLPKASQQPDSLKRSLVKAAAEIPVEKVRAAIAEWSEDLKACVEAECGHFEWHYYK